MNEEKRPEENSVNGSNPAGNSRTSGSPNPSLLNADGPTPSPSNSDSPNLSPSNRDAPNRELRNGGDPSSMPTRSDVLALWRSLKDVDATLPEDLTVEEITAAGDAADLRNKPLGECWQRSRCPMPRLRIATGMEERLIPWYSLLEVRVDASFRIFELFLSGNTVCRIVSRQPQEELYAHLQLERVKVIHPAAGVSVSFE